MRRTIILLALLSGFAWGEPLTFRKAVELAINNSTTSGIAAADAERARQGYLEARNMYLPQMTVGSGLAYSNGFPLSIEGSAPSILNLNSQQFLLNFAGRDFMKAARTEWSAAGKLQNERRADVIFETAAAYSELDKLEGTVQSLAEQEKAAIRVEQVASDRVRAGLDPEVERTRARLGVARVRMAIANARGAADLLRARLAQLTGIKSAQIETVTESIPKLPAPPDAATAQRAAAESGSVKAADEQALAKDTRARAESKLNLPAIDLAGQYALLARYNNYDDFFSKFQRHNVTVGLVIRFPFLNFAQRARAEGAAADAVKAKKQAQEVKDQMESNTIKLQRSVEQLAAARDVARLEYQLASSDTQSMIARVEAGAATLRDQENARLAENQKYSALLDASFALERAQMQLLRLTGQIEQWALGQ